MMDLNYLGERQFLVQARSQRVLLAPPPQPARLRRQNVDVVLSHWMSAATAAELCKQPDTVKLFCGPGEYEVAGIFMRELAWWAGTEDGETPAEQLIYLLRFEEVTLVYLASLTEFPSEEQIEEIGSAQILILPVGGYTTLDVKTQKELIRTFGPHYLIPTHAPELTDTDLMAVVNDLVAGTPFSTIEAVDKFKIKTPLHGETTLLFAVS